MGRPLNSTKGKVKGFCKERMKGSRKTQRRNQHSALPCEGARLRPGLTHLLSRVVAPGEQPLSHVDARGEAVSPGLYLRLDALVVLDDQVCGGNIPGGTETTSPAAHNPIPATSP